MSAKYNQSPNDSQQQNQLSLVPTKNPSVFSVELHLPHKTVYPGKLDFSGEGCFRAKRKQEHIHQKLQAWGVNAAVLDRYEFKWISILCDGREYITSKLFLLSFGKRLTFKNYETQYFLQLKLWGMDAVNEFEKREIEMPQQLSLFKDGKAA